MKKNIVKRIVGGVLCLSMSAMLFTGCGSSSSDAAASDSNAATEEKTDDAAESKDGVYKIALSNSYMGNDWRQLMIKTTQVVAEKEPYASKVKLDVVTCENSAEAQSASVDALVEKGYDAILIDAASTSALVPSIQRALDAGIKVVTFDNVVSGVDGAYTVCTDLKGLSEAWANWLVAKCGDGANIIVDTGIAGSTSGNTMYEAAMAIFDEHKMNVVSEFASEYADGVGQEQIASVLAANADIDGVYSLCYADTVYNAFTDAGRDLVPTTSFCTNGGEICAYDNKMDVLIGNNIAGLGAEAMKIAVEALDGGSPEADTLITAGLFTNDTSVSFGDYKVTQLEEDVTFFRDLPSAFDYPVLADGFGVEVEAKEVADYQQ